MAELRRCPERWTDTAAHCEIDKDTAFCWRHRFLRQGTIVDATLINAPSSTKNKDGKRVPDMYQTKKGNHYYFGMKAHIGVNDESGLVHSLVGTAANVADVTQVDKLPHGAENVVCTDAGYTGVKKRPEHDGREVIWQIAAHQKLGKRSALYKAKRKIEKTRPRGAPRSNIRSE